VNYTEEMWQKHKMRWTENVPRLDT